MTPFEVMLFILGMAAMIMLPFLLKAIPNGYDLTTSPFDMDNLNTSAYN
jgi:hypothetical protein